MGTLTIYCGIGASVAYWALSWPVASTAISATPVASPAPTECPNCARVDALAPLLGARAAAVAAAPHESGNLQLSGVIAHGDGRGVALIAAPGQPARSYRVGSPVQDGLLLQSVGTRKALLSDSMQSKVQQVLELPPSPAH